MITKIIAHRGDKKNYPENTFLAFTHAFKAGVFVVELDVHFSRDGKLPVHHDYYLGRTNNGNGLIFEKNSDYLKSLDSGGWFSKEFKDEKMPFLPQVLDKFSGSLFYEIELKDSSSEFINAVLEEVKKRDLLKHVEFTSPHLFVLKKIKDLLPEACIGLFITPPEEWMDEKLFDILTISNGKMGEINVLHIPSNLINKNRVKLYQSNGFLVHASNCDTKNELKLAFRSGVDQLSTNNITLAVIEKEKYERTIATD